MIKRGKGLSGKGESLLCSGGWGGKSKFGVEAGMKDEAEGEWPVGGRHREGTGTGKSQSRAKVCQTPSI